MKRGVWSLGFTVSLLAFTGAATANADQGDSDAPAAQPPRNDDVPNFDTTPHRPKERLFLAFDGAYAYQSLYGVAMPGVGVTAMLANDLGESSIGVALEGLRGRTDDGLQTTSLSVGPIFQRHFDHLRVGGGVRIGTFDVSRVTSTSSLLSTSAGAYARVSYDIVDLGNEGHTWLCIVGKASVDTVNAPLYAASVGLGVRF